MLLAKIKEALSSLYEDIQETQEIPETPEAPESDVAAEEAEAAAPAAAETAEDSQPEESGAEQAETQPEETEEPAAEPPPPPGPKETDYQTKGFHLDVDLPPEKVVQAAEILSRENFFIESITGVDWIDDQQLEAVYDFNHFIVHEIVAKSACHSILGMG